METLNERAQARYSGVRVAAFRAAMLVGSAGLVVLGGQVHWLFSFLVGGGILISLAVVHQIYLPRRSSVVLTAGVSKQESALVPERDWEKLLRPYRSFFLQKSVFLVISFLAFYKMADALMFSMSTVLLGRELGIGTDLRGGIRFFGILAGILGAAYGGTWIARRGLRNTLLPITILMVVTEPLYALLASFAPQLNLFVDGEAASWQSIVWADDALTLGVVTLVVVIEQVFGGLATAAQVVFIMRRCSIEHKTAHFAFATALYSLAQMMIGATSGVVYELIGSVFYFWAVSALGIPSIILSVLVPKD